MAAQGKQPWEGWWQAAAPPEPVQEKTAQQIVFEKRASKHPQEAQKREQAEAKSAARQAERLASASAPPGLLKGRPWAALAAQLAFALGMSVKLHSAAPMLVALYLAYKSLGDYGAHWPRYLATMLFMAILVSIIR